MTRSEQIGRFIHGTLLMDKEQAFSSPPGTFCESGRFTSFEVLVEAPELGEPQRVRVQIELL